MRNRAFYSYAIEGFETNKNNAAIIDIQYGCGKTPLNIFKKDAEMFIDAIISQKERRERRIERLKEGQDEVEVLNGLLKGRAMILLTDFENYWEYDNNAQNGVKEIVGLLINGKFNYAASFDYESLEPSYEDLYPIDKATLTK